MDLGKNVHVSRLTNIHYLDHWTPERLSSWINAEAKNAGLILLKNVFFTTKTLSFSFFLETLWVYCLVVFQLANPKTLK